MKHCQFLTETFQRNKEGGLVRNLHCKMGVYSGYLPECCEDCTMKVIEDVRDSHD